MKVGIDIGGSHIAVGVIDKDGKIVEKMEKRLTAVEKKDITKSIVEIILEQVKGFTGKYDIDEVGIGMPGWSENGIIVRSGNIGIKDYNLLKALRRNRVANSNSK